VSNILVIVPPEWTLVSFDELNAIIGYTLDNYVSLQGRSMTDINDALVAANWFQDERRISDVLVMNENVYFKLE